MSNISIGELVYNPLVGYDEVCNTPLNYNPKLYNDHESAARALRQALIEYAVKSQGFSQALAESEISCWSPERTKQYSGEERWCVVWESGPYQWAVGLSMAIRGPWGFCEPYYSFDLHFTR